MDCIAIDKDVISSLAWRDEKSEVVDICDF